MGIKGSRGRKKSNLYQEFCEMVSESIDENWLCFFHVPLLGCLFLQALLHFLHSYYKRDRSFLV
ncbi:hypothetical protein JYQ62_10685 [Nostoc sp. UHCC 0702]|nr:hypothetical protein JYQ62_10685 [Nostoc sp. UHCC 0702]